MDDNYIVYLDSYRKMIDDHISLIRELLDDKQVKRYGEEFVESKNSQPEESLNVFKMSSDKYYRENFHSDIIKIFLDPNGKHKEGCTFLFAFIDFINDNFESCGISICKSDYRSAIIEREKGRIDILIKSTESMHCIIIENKTNNAVDAERQLPRYYDEMTKHGYKVDAIVYLPLDPGKKPDESIWTAEDKRQVKPLLCIVPAYQKRDLSLVTGWIEPCTLKTRNLDCVLILRHFGELLKSLSNNIMDNVILGKFYQTLMDNQRIETALSIQSMLKELPAYMADRLFEKFKALGVDGVWQWPPRPDHCGVMFPKEGVFYKIDIWSSLNGYEIHVFSQDNCGHYTDWAEGFSSLKSFSCNPDKTAFIKSGFKFYDEDKVIECVQPIVAEIREWLRQQ